MARSTGSDGRDDFERQWEAIAEQLGDLQPAEPFETDAVPSSAGSASDSGSGPAADDGWGADADFAMGGPRDYEPAEDEGFVPPPPPAISTARPWLVVGWAGLALSAVLLLLSGILRTLIPVQVSLVAGAGLLISLIVLFTQLPKGKRDPDDPDKGAVV